MNRNSFNKINIFCQVLLCILLPALSWAAESPITANAAVDRNPITLGDIITYTIVVRHDSDLQTSSPDLSQFDGFDVLENQASPPRDVAGKIEQEFSVKLRADKVGVITIPPLPVPFSVNGKEKGTAVPGEIRTPEISVEVQSVLHTQGEPTDIRDIKDMEYVGINWMSWVFPGLNILLLLIAIYLFWKFRKLKSPDPTPKKMELAPHQIALLALDALKSKKLLEQGQSRQHFFELSEIFRRYLGQRFHFPASDWTTEEIATRLHALSELNVDSREECLRILRKSDLIKFAKAEAPADSNEIDPVRVLIESIRERKTIGLYAE